MLIGVIDSGLGGLEVVNNLDVNEEINSVIYRQITKRGESAFVNFLVYPTLILAIAVIFSLIVRMLSLS